MRDSPPGTGTSAYERPPRAATGRVGSRTTDSMEVAVLLVLAGAIALIVVIARRQGRAQATPHAPEDTIEKKRRLLEEVHSAREAIEQALDEARAALATAHDELDSARAPPFWDALDHAEHLLDHCVDAHERANAAAREYERLAATQSDPYEHDPSLRWDPEGIYRTLIQAIHELIETSNTALTIDVFAIVYEQRRQGARLLQALRAMHGGLETLHQQQAQMREEMHQDLHQVMKSARAAERTAAKARSAAKRAAGDWI